MKRLSFKQPRELFVQAVDFAALLASGETITWTAAGVSVARGTAADQADIVKSTLVSVSTVKLTLQKGTTNNFYRIQVLASTSAGNVWEEDLVLPVWDFYS